MSGTLSSANIKYSSDMQNRIKAVEKKQAQQNFNRPEYLSMFDELSFDNISIPAGENDTYKTVLGYNASLKRDLQVRDNYSYFDNTTDGTYNIVAKNNFTHNNMAPNTTQRDINKSQNYSQRKLDIFTGSKTDLVLKKEKIQMFEPMKDLTWVNGAPVMSGELKQRYLPSNKNNMGNLPFESQVRVAPGIGTQVQTGRHEVYRMEPINVDGLRSDINKKITYNSKPLETIKKGEFRGPDFNLTKYKLPDFRTTDFGDLIPNASVVSGERKEGDYTNMDTTRGFSDIYYPGPSSMTTMGDGPDIGKTKYTESNKESYMNDPTHNMKDVNTKPVFTNIESWSNNDNQRTTINTNYQGPVQNATSTYSLNYNDVARQTVKETTSHDIISNLSNPTVYTQYTQYSDDAKMTIKQTTSHAIVSNLSNPNNFTEYTPFNDNAKMTIKETTSHAIVSNLSNPNNFTEYKPYSDNAKTTIKQMTSHAIVSNLSNPNNFTEYKPFEDNAKTTIKQMTSHDIVSNLSNPTQYTQYLKNNDIAKATTKQSTINNIQSVNVTTNVKDSYSNIVDPMRETTRQSTIASNRPEGNLHNTQTGSLYYIKDKNDIARKTMKENVEQTKYIGHAIDTFDNSTYTQLEDEMRPTTKQSTLSAQPISNVYMSSSVNYSRNPKDIARETIKQSIIDNNYIGNTRYEVEGPVSHIAANNMHQNECRETSTFNRPANGKSDQTGPYINRNTFEPNEPLLYSYTGPAFRKLDQTNTPQLTQSQILCINQVKTDSKPIIDRSTYYINKNFINTLDNNPYVNDIYHQKNL